MAWHYSFCNRLFCPKVDQILEYIEYPSGTETSNFLRYLFAKKMLKKLVEVHWNRSGDSFKYDWYGPVCGNQSRSEVDRHRKHGISLLERNEWITFHSHALDVHLKEKARLSWEILEMWPSWGAWRISANYADVKVQGDRDFWLETEPHWLAIIHSSCTTEKLELWKRDSQVKPRPLERLWIFRNP